MPESFELNGKHPMVRCHGGYTKNGSEAVLPLRRDVAQQLVDWLAGKPAGQSVWSGKWASHRHGAEMIRIDLTAADVEYEDVQGRVVDFHALRHTFISNLARAGVHPRNAQALARHSSIDLTMNVYTHVSMNDLANDIESLSAITGKSVAACPNSAEAREPADTPIVPEELANIASNWDSLPEHVRSAIGTLAGV